MRVVVLTNFAGLGFSYSAGEEIDVPEKLAVEWLKAGFVALSPEEEMETATQGENETAVIGRKKKKKVKGDGGA